ncbi:MAG: phosphoenolpyruvate carboxykinase domain-containing protein, partial [Prevotella sp.]|nr:phosphoenolpyruvate carboxykinase domain-containing protein [Prevotella sp.]
SLKWLMQRYHIDNLELTPVNMPHGEYKFMSNDIQLLNQLDKAYTDLYSSEELLPLQNKWFYPERVEKPMPTWLWVLIATAALLLVLLGIYSISYRIQARRLRRQNERGNKRLAMILETSQMRIWTYDIESSQFTWHNENGQVGYTYTIDEFSHRYSADDFAKLKSALEQLSQLGKDEANKELTLELRAKDIEDDDSEMRDYRVVLSVFRRNKEGRPTVIICTRKDITKELQMHRLSAERTLRYWSIFYTPIVGIIMFDRNGVMTNINPKACELLACDSDEALEQHTLLSDLLDTGGLSLEQTEGYYATLVADMDRQEEPLRQVKFKHKTGELYMEFLLMTVYDDNQEFSDVLAICRDVSGVVSSIDHQSQMRRRTEAVRAELKDYTSRINTVLSGSDVRLASYSPVSHTLTIYNRNDEMSHALPQTRCMTLVAEHSKSIAMHMLNRMDKREQKAVEATVTTTLRIKGQQLVLQFKLQPVSDAQGKVTEYQGLCQDISELCHLQGLLAIETEKVQEVENTKNSFVKNMVQEIRTPMNTVINYVAQLGDKAPKIFNVNWFKQDEEGHFIWPGFGDNM